MEADPLIKQIERLVMSKEFRKYAEVAGLPKDFRERKKWVLDGLGVREETK